MALTPEIAVIIAERVREYDIPSDEIFNRAIKAALEIGALPILSDAGGIFALRPDGEIISILWDEPEKMRVESDQRIRNIALQQGSEKYPELKELVSARPDNAQTCPHCQGTGVEPFSAKHNIGNVVCYCGGLGWIPKEDTE